MEVTEGENADAKLIQNCTQDCCAWANVAPSALVGGVVQGQMHMLAGYDTTCKTRLNIRSEKSSDRFDDSPGLSDVSVKRPPMRRK